MSRYLSLTSALLTAALLGSATAASTDVPTPEETKAQLGHLGPVPVPDDNPMTKAKVDLGARLFADPGLSGDGSMACQSCHLPDHGFAVDQALGPAYPSKQERRNSPTLINVAFNQPLIWDGRAPNLDKQTLGPIGNILHMNNNLDLMVEQLQGTTDYPQAFMKAFGDEDITTDRIAKAIATFERTLVFDDAPIDRYMDGDASALSDQHKRGLALFLGKGNCIACHNGPNLTDNQFHNLGVPDDQVTGDPAVMAAIRFDTKRTGWPKWASVDEDIGRAQITKDPADIGKFRTMGLRNIRESAPYMHNGALATLEDVVRFYDSGGGTHPNKSPLLQPLGLTDQEVQDLVAFLREALQGKQRSPQFK
jgi:cytochrome c peroxidase